VVTIVQKNVTRNVKEINKMNNNRATYKIESAVLQQASRGLHKLPILIQQWIAERSR
jgi:hypothetical protein